MATVILNRAMRPILPFIGELGAFAHYNGCIQSKAAHEETNAEVSFVGRFRLLTESLRAGDEKKLFWLRNHWQLKWYVQRNVQLEHRAVHAVNQPLAARCSPRRWAAAAGVWHPRRRPFTSSSAKPRALAVIESYVIVAGGTAMANPHLPWTLLRRSRQRASLPDQRVPYPREQVGSFSTLASTSKSK